MVGYNLPQENYKLKQNVLDKSYTTLQDNDKALYFLIKNIFENEKLESYTIFKGDLMNVSQYENSNKVADTKVIISDGKYTETITGKVSAFWKTDKLEKDKLTIVNLDT